MTKEFKKITQDVNEYMTKLRKEIPDVMMGFSSMAKSAIKPNALDTKTKELVALGIAVATRCDACLGFHTQSLVKLGASREEVVETLGMAIYMGGGPSLMYAADALRAYEQALKADTV